MKHDGILAGRLNIRSANHHAYTYRDRCDLFKADLDLDID